MNKYLLGPRHRLCIKEAHVVPFRVAHRLPRDEVLVGGFRGVELDDQLAREEIDRRERRTRREHVGSLECTAPQCEMSYSSGVQYYCLCFNMSLVPAIYRSSQSVRPCFLIARLSAEYCRI